MNCRRFPGILTLLLSIGLASASPVEVSGPCRVVGDCLQSDSYGGNATYNEGVFCSFTNVPSVPLTTTAFHSMGYYSYDVYYSSDGSDSCHHDYLEIDGTKFCGTSGPDGVVPTSGTIRWQSHGQTWRPDGVASGWEICFLLPPSQPPMPPQSPSPPWSPPQPLQAPSPPLSPAEHVSTVGALVAALLDSTVTRIVLAAGTYLLTAQLDIGRSLALDAALPGTVVIDVQSLGRVVAISAGVVRLTGLNITGGWTAARSIDPSASSTLAHGGGLAIFDGVVTLVSCNIYNNSAGSPWAGGEGGGLYVFGATVALINCTIWDNKGDKGGGIAQRGGTLTLATCEIYRNLGHDLGGGVYLAGGGGTLTLSSCSIYSNVAEGTGGGLCIYVAFTLVALSNCIIFGNSALEGAGLSAVAGSVTVIGCTIYGNDAGGGSGGGVFIFKALVLMNGCSISSNTHKGGVFLVGGSATFTSCSILNNHGGSGIGGGLTVSNFGYDSAGTNAKLDSCVVSGNSAPDEGGGIFMLGGILTLTRTLVSSNTAPVGANVLPTSGNIYYELPTVAGYWLPNSRCVVNREGCSPYDDTCKARIEACATSSGTASVDWRPRVEGYRCPPPILMQPCDWQTVACQEEDAVGCILGKQVYAAPFLAIDTTFPNPCG